MSGKWDILRLTGTIICRLLLIVDNKTTRMSFPSVTIDQQGHGWVLRAGTGPLQQSKHAMFRTQINCVLFLVNAGNPPCIRDRLNGDKPQRT